MPWLIRKVGDVRQYALESNVIPFPSAQYADRGLFREEIDSERGERLPFGLCLVIWTALSAVGWGAIDAAIRLI